MRLRPRRGKAENSGERAEWACARSHNCISTAYPWLNTDKLYEKKWRPGGGLGGRGAEGTLVTGTFRQKAPWGWVGPKVHPVVPWRQGALGGGLCGRGSEGALAEGTFGAPWPKALFPPKRPPGQGYLQGTLGVPWDLLRYAERASLVSIVFLGFIADLLASRTRS